jgi:hypothetical protein
VLHFIVELAKAAERVVIKNSFHPHTFIDSALKNQGISLIDILIIYQILIQLKYSMETPLKFCRPLKANQ